MLPPSISFIPLLFPFLLDQAKAEQWKILDPITKTKERNFSSSPLRLTSLFVARQPEKQG
jgi:hypothetical protein